MEHKFPVTVVEAYRTRASVDKAIGITQENICKAKTATEVDALNEQLHMLYGLRVSLSLFIYDRIGF